MATKNPPPQLQIAQILADLSDLNIAEPDAALSLVTAHQNLHLFQSKPSRSSSSSYNNYNNNRNNNSYNNSKPPLSLSSSHLSQEDDRRRSGTPGTLSRALSRNDSAGSGMSGAGSGVWERFQTPNPGVEADPDLERASTLMHLYEMRGRFKQQENGGLARARANVEAVAEGYERLG